MGNNALYTDHCCTDIVIDTEIAQFRNHYKPKSGFITLVHNNVGI